jgi:WD40 repeat protein
VAASTALIEQVAFSADGRYFGSVSDDGTVSVYPGATKRLPSRVAKLDGGGLDLQIAFSHDSGLLAVASASNVVHLWKRSGTAWTSLSDLEGYDNYVYGVAFSPDGGTFAAAGADKLVRIYRVEGNRFTLVQTLSGPTNSIMWLDFDRAGRLLSGASQDGNVWLWRIRNGRASLYAKLAGLGSKPYTTHLDPTMPAVMATGASGRVDDWSIDVPQSVDAICAAAGTPISRQEWKQYVPGAPYAPPCQNG